MKQSKNVAMKERKRFHERNKMMINRRKFVNEIRTFKKALESIMLEK